MKYKNLSSFLFLVSAIVLISSCGGTKKGSDSSSEEFEKAKAELQQNVKKVLYEIPSPVEIPAMLRATGADFDGSIINSIDKLDSYAPINDKAVLNLGIYAADIGYLSSYDKTQESLTYMRACRKLADNLGLGGSFSPKIIDRFERNIESKDSLATLVNQTIADAEDLLKEDDRGTLAALLITGSFIEGLYISTQIVENYPKDILPEDTRNLILTPLIRLILDQRKPTEDLIAMLKGVDQNESTSLVLESLNKIKANFDALNIDEQIKNNRADLVLTNKTLSEITATVAKLRKDITS